MAKQFSHSITKERYKELIKSRNDCVLEFKKKTNIHDIVESQF